MAGQIRPKLLNWTRSNKKMGLCIILTRNKEQVKYVKQFTYLGATRVDEKEVL